MLDVRDPQGEEPDASDGRPELRAEAERRQEREAREFLELMVEPVAVPIDVIVERVFGVRFPSSEVAALDSVGELLDLINAKR